ncbi:DNA polymerase III subunit gamma and tau [Arthrobacter sp. NPDC093125]|uniref:DNA polymerase III subunit gamma and tau n=1 Tax=Arthrobacter sp. NPDC093125 TaxID=3363944 RepID=UPI003824C0FC
MTVTTALYRRYRPDSFADVIGQEHVTEPLMTALRKNRVNHAYLFSGPRGCGKTTSARILARCLNCAKGPTDTPCGVCRSCIELARGGSGSLDVIEIDAASHGGVDDARDLRERATYAPVRDRYKIFIIDEAHMVTSAGFNALLKIVEEPPEHIKFIFATTEPDKVIGTIRSRTHHYPFRLVPPEPLMAYLELLCQQENVPVAPGVLSLVIRAGAGSVRDSLSVLDQLMAGAGPNGLDYELAVALLGYTHASLLDDVVEAIAASDSATVFRAVDRVIQTGHDPRRFVEDLLERFRDLIIVQAMPESAQSILRGMPADQIARMQNQAHNLGGAELSRAADVTNTALTEMTGATSPRLHLELLCARILLPSAEQTERGIAARIDRVERRLNYAGNDVGTPAAAVAAPAAAPHAPASPSAAAAPAPAVPAVPAAAAAVPAAPVPAAAAPAAAAQPSSVPGTSMPDASVPAAAAPVAGPPATAPAGGPAQREPMAAPRISTSDWPVDEPQPGTGRFASGPVVGSGRESAPPLRADQPGQAERPAAMPQRPAAQSAPHQAEPAQPVRPASEPDSRPASTGAPAPAPSAAPAPAGGGDVEVLRRAWPEVLQTLAKIKRSTWALVEPNAQVGQFDGQVLTLVFTTPGLAGAFGRADHSENLRQAIHKTIGIDCQIAATAGASNSPASSDPNPKGPTSRDIPAPTTDADWGLAPADTESGGGIASGAQKDKGLAPAAPSRPVAAAPAAHRPAETPGPAGEKAARENAAPARAVRETPVRDSQIREHISGSSAVTASRPASAPVDATRPVSAPVEPGAEPRVAYAVESAEVSHDSSYSYPDDDWGPPLDEDAPPLDEEPPMDWEPAPRQETRSVSPPSEPSRTVPAPAPNSGVDRPAADASADPWSRAVEQAPGVWLLGSESNVGKYTRQPEEKPQAPAAPRYEPATAQVPAESGADNPSPVMAPPAAFPATGNQHIPATIPEDEPGREEEPGRETRELAPVYAMASAPAEGSRETAFAPSAAPSPRPHLAPTTVTAVGGAPAGAPAAGPDTAPATGTPAGRGTAALAAPAAGREKLSLYQRLSNSPEAEAGRAKALSRQAEPTVSYVQDIPSVDDETIEESGVFGRAAVERILGGKLIEERSLDGNPLVPRY